MKAKQGTNRVGNKRVTVIRPTSIEVGVQQDPSLHQLQEWVGGDIEMIPSFKRYEGKPCIAYFNEEGKLRKLPINASAASAWHQVCDPMWRAEPIYGTVVIIQNI